MATLATKVEQFIKLRDHKTAAKKAFDESMQRVNQAIDKLEGEIMAALEAEGLKNAKSESGTAYLITQSSASVKDRDAFEEWAEETGNRGAMDIRANKKAIRELLDEGVEEIPGVSYSERVTIGVRRS
jgi:hypothetical protein